MPEGIPQNNESPQPENVLEKSFTPEQQEILAKAVDIYKTPGLKFREGDIEITLKQGLIGEIVQKAIPEDVLYAPEKKNLLPYRGAIREQKKIRDEYIRGEESQIALDKKIVGSLGNVYYPDGAIDILKSIITGERSSELYLSEDTTKRRGHSTDGEYIVLRKMWGKTMPEGLQLLLKAHEMDFDSYGKLITVAQSEPELKEKILNMWPEIRYEIMKDFLQVAFQDRTDPNFFIHPLADTRSLNQGVIFKSELEAKSHPDSDYPTQAVVMGLRASSKDIIGIYCADEEALKNHTITWGNIKEYETFVGLAEKYKVPLYNLKGDILWPVEIPHEKINSLTHTGE